MNERRKGQVRALVSLALSTFTAASRAQDAPSLPTEMQRAGFSASQIASVQAGATVARLVTRPDDNAAFAVGVTRIAASALALMDEIRRIGTADSKLAEGRTLQAGRFGRPPGIDDIQRLVVERQDLRDLSRCRIGDCDIQVNRRTMELARAIDWKAPDADRRAERLLKATLLDRVKLYLQDGMPALNAYDDGLAPERVGSGVAHILESSPEMLQRNPRFYEYLLGFPKVPSPPALEEFVYWSKDTVLKPVVSIVHVLLQPLEKTDQPRYFVAMTHIYDSHYFLAYSDFLTLIPEPAASDGFYLLRSVRAMINPPRGWLRGILLGRIKRALRDQLADELLRTKRLVEDRRRPPAKH